MSKVIKRDGFGYLGADFQLRLVAQLLVDTKFAESIVEIIDANYFEDQSLKIIVSTIKDAYNEYNIIPDIGSLEFRLLDKITNEFDQKYALQQLKAIKDVNFNDGLAVQDKAMKFCKQQELNKAIKEIQKIIDRGDISQYDYCEEVLKKAMEHGDNKDNAINITDNIEAVLADDFRKPIPTGIKGLDEIMDGGLSKQELAIVLAPFGVGKTTFMTKVGNTAKDLGYNVLQIFFEDMPKVIQRKHLACWSGYDLNSLTLHRDELKELAIRKNEEPGVLKLKKFSSDGTTIPMIRQYIRKQIAEGFKPDLILLDYIDCVVPSKKFDDVNAGEGSVMRQFEAMLADFDIAGWTAVQGNRSSIKAEVVEADQMGGSIKKGQIGHFVLSIAKTLDQKENGTATIAILKSRFGKDGIILQDIIFNNGTIQINMGANEAKSTGNYNKDKEKEEKQYVAGILDVIRKRKEALAGAGNPMATVPTDITPQITPLTN
jgi:replicative DNA helicase